jgi:hypothetical protein
MSLPDDHRLTQAAPAAVAGLLLSLTDAFSDAVMRAVLELVPDAFEAEEVSS